MCHKTKCNTAMIESNFAKSRVNPMFVKDPEEVDKESLWCKVFEEGNEGRVAKGILHKKKGKVGHATRGGLMRMQ